MNYIKDPKIIYENSFAKAREISNLDKIAPEYHNMIIRMIHSSTNPKIAKNIVINGKPILSIKQKLTNNNKTIILTDCNMLKSGISKKYLPEKSKIICSIGKKKVISKAEKNGVTRSIEQVNFWHKKGLIPGSIILIGNAPTCLFRLIEIMKKTIQQTNPISDKYNKKSTIDILPAAILAFPTGFIGAKEAKEELINSKLSVNYITIKGKSGGSAIAASAFNAIIRDITLNDKSNNNF